MPRFAPLFNDMGSQNLDMMIAAHALAVEAVLVANARSFRLGKLKLEDWTK